MYGCMPYFLIGTSHLLPPYWDLYNRSASQALGLGMNILLAFLDIQLADGSLWNFLAS
jgi:hypothetical protein